MSLNAFIAASRFYAAALDLWPQADHERPSVLFDLGRSRARGEAAGDDALTEARDAFLAAGDREAAAEAEVELAEHFGNQGRRPLEQEHIGRAVALLEGLPASPTKAYALTQQASSLLMASRITEAIAVGVEALEIAETLGLHESEAHALNVIGMSQVDRGDPEGIGNLERGLAIAVEHNLVEAVRAYGNLAEAVSNYRGDLNRAFELRAEARQVAERFGVVQHIRWFAGERVLECYWSGRWDEAQEIAGELLSQSETGSPNYMDVMAYDVRARIALARGEAGAWDEAERALQLARAVKDPQVVYPVLASSARAAAFTGRADVAAALVDELLASWVQSADTMLASNLQSFVDAAEVLRTIGRGRELVEIGALARVRTPWVEAATAYASGDFSSAAEIYARAGSLPDEALARLRSAEVLIGGGNRAEGDRELQKALSFYRSVGATAYLRGGEALLARTA
jgi:tetratricopeptide (TPR) repeat protein